MQSRVCIAAQGNNRESSQAFLDDSAPADVFAGAMPGHSNPFAESSAAGAQAGPASWEGDAAGDVPAVPSASGEVAIDFIESTTAGGHTQYHGSLDLQAATEGGAGSGGASGPSGGNAGQNGQKTAPYQLAHYARFFDVDTTDVLKRMLGAIAFRRDMFPEVEAQPDLYGPFWIVTSIVFLMAMISNALEWLTHSKAGDAWAGDPHKIVYGASILYGYVFGAGLLLWGWLKVINLASISLAALWCLFGYSMTVWLPVACLAVIPSPIFLWVLCLAASGYSGVFLVLNLKTPVQESLVASKQAVTLLIVFVAHNAVAVLLRIFVLTYEIGTQDTGKGDRTMLT